MVATQSVDVPVIAIDGPTASGKGTVARRVADELGWRVLDSGALYRLAAWLVIDRNLDAGDIERVSEAARRMDIRFEADRITLEGHDITDAIRQEHVGDLASRLAQAPMLRDALLDRQRAFRSPPGLVADGRDMGTVVFTDAPLKIFLIADVAARARRRVQQLQARGQTADYAEVLEDLMARDQRDFKRLAAPLKPADDAVQIDSSGLSVEQTVAKVLSLWRQQGLES